MKNLIVLILVLSLLNCDMKDKNSIDYDYFLIGTLSDYMGREKYQTVEDRVDKYSQSEQQLCMTIDSIFKNSYPDLEISSSVHKISKKNEFELYSKALAKRIESFYSYKASGRMAYHGQDDFEKLNLDSLTKTPDFYSTNFDTIYTGRLKLNVFETEKQKLSFITGAYVRYGWHVDSLYHIRVFNSISKVRILNELLKDVGCTNVEYEIKKGYIPTGHTVSFFPTEQLNGYFEKYIKLK
jgi:hypothetical protein